MSELQQELEGNLQRRNLEVTPSSNSVFQPIRNGQQSVQEEHLRRQYQPRRRPVRVHIEPAPGGRPQIRALPRDRTLL